MKTARNVFRLWMRDQYDANSHIIRIPSLASLQDLRGLFCLPNRSGCCPWVDSRTPVPDSRKPSVWCSLGISGYYHVSWPCSKPWLLVSMPKNDNRWAKRRIIQELPGNHLYKFRVRMWYFERQLIGIIIQSCTCVTESEESETYGFLCPEAFRAMNGCICSRANVLDVFANFNRANLEFYELCEDHQNKGASR